MGCRGLLLLLAAHATIDSLLTYYLEDVLSATEELNPVGRALLHTAGFPGLLCPKLALIAVAVVLG